MASSWSNPWGGGSFWSSITGALSHIFGGPGLGSTPGPPPLPTTWSGRSAGGASVPGLLTTIGKWLPGAASYYGKKYGPALASTGLEIYSAHQASEAARDMARDQMAFQERMANTAHQRQIEDMRAAGLNPALSGMGGKGADSPGGASGQVFKVNYLDALNSASARQLQAAQTIKTAAEAKNLPKTGYEIDKRVDKLIADTEYTAKGVDLLGKQTAEVEQKLKIGEQLLRSATSNADKDEALKAIYKAAAPLIEKGGKLAVEIVEYIYDQVSRIRPFDPRSANSIVEWLESYGIKVEDNRDPRYAR